MGNAIEFHQADLNFLVAGGNLQFALAPNTGHQIGAATGYLEQIRFAGGAVMLGGSFVEVAQTVKFMTVFGR